MRIEIRGRNTEVGPELEEHIRKRFAKIGKQVSELATLEVEVSEERNPAIADRHIVEATLFLKGTTLRAREASPEALHSVAEAADDVRRQVKRHREKRRKRSRTRQLVSRMRGRAA